MNELQKMQKDFAEYAKSEESGMDITWGDSYIVQKWLEDAYNLGRKHIDKHSSSCPLTNSSHEKALVRVVENYTDEWGNRDFIQVLCSCGHIISEAEIKSK